MSVIKKEAFYISSDGTHKIRALIWQDEKAEPIGVFQIAHGSGEHIGRYDEFARFLAENGYVVCGNDHLGHGMSVSDEAELGVITDAECGWIRMVDDMHLLGNIMKSRFPALPYFIFGYSMGSFAARIYASRFGAELTGAIFCGTTQMPAATELVIGGIDAVIARKGPAQSAQSVAKLSGILSSLQFPGERGDPMAWLARSAQTRQEDLEDPLCSNDMSLGLLRTLLKLGAKASDRDWASMLPADLAVMFISGAKDPAGFNGTGVLLAADKCEKRGIDPTVILYPGDRHDLIHEDNREKVFEDILKWLRSVTEGKAE